MHWPRATPEGSSVSSVFDPPAGCAAAILAVTSACVAVGVAALAVWRISGNTAWIRDFFLVPGALMMLWLAAVQVWLSVAATRHFATGEPMRSVWTLIAFSAACNAISTVCVQVLGVDSFLNPLTRASGWWSPGIAGDFQTAGKLIGGPVRFMLLAGGLYRAVGAYRQARFLGRLLVPDWIVLAAFTLYLSVSIAGVMAATRAGTPLSWSEVANWPTDPLLWVLLAEAMLLRRSVQQMGSGWIGRCWAAFSVGVFLTVLGDVGGWAEAYGYLQYPWNSVVWFVWLPAAACFALAPAYQLETIRFAMEGRVSG